MTLNNFIIDANITWDRVSKSIFEKPQAKPGRKLRVQVTNAGVVDNLTGYTLHLGWRNSVNGIEGLDIFTAVDATKGLFELQYTEGMLSNAGSLRASLVLVNIADVTIAESNDFVIRVTPSPFSQDASQSTTSLTSLAEILLNEASREQAAAEQAAAFETYDQRIEQLETGVKHEVTNIITTNSDFATTEGFALFGASVATANNVMTITGTGFSSLPNAGFNLPNIPTGAKVYMRVWARVLNAVCSKISIRSESTEIASKVNPIENQWYEIAAVRTKTGALETALNMAMTHTYADSATANGKQMEVKWAVAIQLTEDFGAGMEPTADYTTFMLNIYDNKYFSGTATVYPVQSVAENLASVEQRIDDRFDEFVESNIVPETVTQKMLDFESASGGRLVSVEQQLEQTVVKADTASLKADAMASGSPKGVYTTLALLQAAYPTGTTGAYLVTADGKWYYWSGSAWTIGGTYQSTGIADESIHINHISSDLTSPFVGKKATVTPATFENHMGLWVSYNVADLDMTNLPIDVSYSTYVNDSNVRAIKTKIIRGSAVSTLQTDAQYDKVSSETTVILEKQQNHLFANQAFTMDFNYVNVFIWAMATNVSTRSAYYYKELVVKINGVARTPELTRFYDATKSGILEDATITFPNQLVKYSDFLTGVGGANQNYLSGKKIVAIGDSMVKGHTLTDAQTWLYKLAARNNMTHVNYGENGANLSNNSSTYGTPVVGRYSVMDSDADYVLVFAGTNDANGLIAIGTDVSTDATTFKGALNVLCSGLITKYPAKKIAFITPYLRNANYPAYITAIETICAKYGISVFNNSKNGGVDWTNTAQKTALTLNDTYHLNEAGMEYASYKYEAFIRSL